MATEVEVKREEGQAPISLYDTKVGDCFLFDQGGNGEALLQLVRMPEGKYALFNLSECEHWYDSSTITECLHEAGVNRIIPVRKVTITYEL